MDPFFNRDPQYLAQTFARYVQAIVVILTWIVVGLAALAAAYAAIRVIWAAVQLLQRAIGA